MGQGKENDWLCRRNGTAEMLNEGDGNWLVRSAMNRDRTLRLTASELEQLVVMVVQPSTNAPAPESVGRTS